MSASTLDKITDVRNAARPNSARASGTRSAGGTSLSCDNLAGWPTASKVHFVTYQIDSNSNPIAGTQLDCYGIVSGNSIGSFTVVDGTDTGNSIGDVVEMLPTAAWGQDLADALTNQHTRLGAHKGITTDTIVVSSGSTLPAGDIITADLATSAVTTPKLKPTIIQSNFSTHADFTTASASYVDVTSMSFNYVAGATNETLLLVLNATATNAGSASICEVTLNNGSDLDPPMRFDAVTASRGSQLYIMNVVALSTTTLKLRARVAGGNTMTVFTSVAAVLPTISGFAISNV